MNTSNPLTAINFGEAMSNTLATSFGIQKYLEIIDAIHSEDFKADGDFRKKFNSYYKVMCRSGDWYKDYYKLMVEQKGEKRSFEEILKKLSKYGNVEVSFASKLVSAIDPGKPIWDQYVIKNLGLYTKWDGARNKSLDERIEVAKLIYETIETWYTEFLETKAGQEFVKEFDAVLPDHKERLSNVKKLDYILWSQR